MFVEKYKKKLDGMNITNKNKDHIVFKHWKGITRGLFATKNLEIEYNFDINPTINTDDINKVDISGNIILYFIVDELTKLLQYNSDGSYKTAISHFIIDFINTVFELFNTENYQIISI
jgi:hypothetical protein